MDEIMKEGLRESLIFWEEHLKGVKYLPTGRGLFDELFPPEKIEKILGE